MMSPSGRRQPRTSLSRKVAVRTPRKTLTIFCEGKNTEPEYFEALKREPDVRDVAAVELRVEPDSAGCAPLTLVRMAVDAKNKADGERSEVDEFWCVFDVEWPKQHANLNEAVNLADAHGIRLAISNPCFETWLILHFADHRKFVNNDDARRLRRKWDGQQGKSLDGALYMPRRMDASARAERLLKFHEQNGNRMPHDNPSSTMFRLVVSTSPPRAV